MSIAELLHEGRENALTIRELEKITGLDGRIIRRKIHAEREAGTIIIADNVNGYYLPADFRDIKRFARSMNHRAKEIAKISRAAEDALARAEGQTTAEGWSR